MAIIEVIIPNKRGHWPKNVTQPKLEMECVEMELNSSSLDSVWVCLTPPASLPSLPPANHPRCL